MKIMKKTYIIPEMEVVKIQMQHMLAASPNQVNEIVGVGEPLGREFDYEFGDEFDFDE